MPSGPEFGAHYSPDENSHPVCPRHPDRVAFVRCQRCSQPVCPECQVPTEVGVICVDCAKAAQQRAPREHNKSFTDRRGHPIPLITYILLGINVVLYAGQWISQLSNSTPSLTQQLWYQGLHTSSVALQTPELSFEPWRMITSTFIHSVSSPVHLLMNMALLWMLGRVIEPAMGWSRFLAVYLLSALGGSVAVLWLAAPNVAVLGASGAIYGLFAALFIMTRDSGASVRSIVILIGINLVISFTVPNVSWQGHLGGLIVGGLASGAMVLIQRKVPGARSSVHGPSTPEGRAKSRQIMWLAFVGILMLLIIATWLGGARLDLAYVLENMMR